MNTPLYVAAGRDCSGEPRGLGISTIAFKLTPHAGSDLLILENTFTARMLITFVPAGQMEAFFRIVTQANAMPPQDPALWRAHGMELVGPPLDVRKGE